MLVSRDEDLLALKSHGQTGIVHVAEFLRRVTEIRQSPETTLAPHGEELRI